MSFGETGMSQPELDLACEDAVNAPYGEMTGSERPDEVVITGGHIDAWDTGVGAMDDGMGVAITMKAAAMIGALAERPARTIRSVAFGAEELGLLGARAYAEEYADTDSTSTPRLTPRCCTWQPNTTGDSTGRITRQQEVRAVDDAAIKEKGARTGGTACGNSSIVTVRLSCTFRS
jgi:Zn-dependent M28 family amino/carboxypeptidase